jgi:hypothetical protein
MTRAAFDTGARRLDLSASFTRIPPLMKRLFTLCDHQYFLSHPLLCKRFFTRSLAARIGYRSGLRYDYSCRIFVPSSMIDGCPSTMPDNGAKVPTRTTYKECGNANSTPVVLLRKLHLQCGHDLMGCLFGGDYFFFVALFYGDRRRRRLQMVGKGLS